jgi:hypothetical protein
MSGPHDRCFCWTYKDRARAKALLRHNLPRELVARMNWSTLEREPSTLVDPVRETRKDVLFSARYRNSRPGDPPHYFIIEHQSEQQWWMVLRLHDYTRRIIENWREEHPRSKQIPEVTALVVYTKRGKPWRGPRSMERLYDSPRRRGNRGRNRSRAHSRVHFTYHVDDMAVQSVRKVLARPGPALGPLVLLILSFARTRELARRLYSWRKLMARVYAEPNGSRLLRGVLRYLYLLGDKRAFLEMKRVLHSFMKPERAERLMRTMAEILMERGRKEAEAKRRPKWEAKGQAMSVLKVLAARGVRVDAGARRRIQNCKDPAKLDRWLLRAANATRLEDVLDEPAQ